MRRFTGHIAVVAALALTFHISAAGPQADSPKDTAAALARKAKRAEKSGHASEAYVLYSEAAALVPGNRKFTALMKSTQSRADKEAAQALASPSAEPGLEEPATFDSLTAREFANARQMEGPVSLMAKQGTQDFDLSGTARSLFDQVAQAFGLAVTYDSDYAAAGQTLRFRVSGVDYKEALHDLEAVSGSFVTPLSAHLLMVAQDTPNKRSALEQTVSLSVPFPQATTPQELTEIVQIIRQAMNVEKIAIDTIDNAIVIRDRMSRAAPAQALLAQMFAFRPEISVELEFIEVSDSDLINYGFNVTNSFQAVELGSLFHNATAAPSGVANLVTFGGGKTLIGLGVAQAQAMFNETIASGRTLFRAEVRSVDNQPATFHVGERYPVITSAFAGSTATSAATTGTTYAPPPVFQYQDLGVQVKITPHIHGTGDVTLAVDTSFQLLTGDSVNNIPIIGRRQLTTEVRLRDNEWAVVAGLMSPTESKAVSGFWGLAQIPILGNLFRQTSTQKQDSHILIAIKPQLLSLPASQIVSRPLRVGTETRPFTPL
jgi:type II secretory pathway component GspD/PulD (secretin)